MSEIRNAWGFTLFADDLRHEIGGKVSLIGIYPAELIQPMEFPITIPKLAMLIKYYEVKGALKGDLNMKIFLPGDPEGMATLSWTISEATKGTAQTPYEPASDGDIVFNLTMPIIVSPLTIKEEGFVRVRVQSGDTTTRLGRLMIRKVRDTDNLHVIPSTIASAPLSSQSPPAAPASC